MTKGVAESYSPPRMTLVAPEFGLRPMWALDLTLVDGDDGEPWNFDNPSKREKAASMLREDEPSVVMLGPPCAPSPRSPSGGITAGWRSAARSRWRATDSGIWRLPSTWLCCSRRLADIICLNTL